MDLSTQQGRRQQGSLIKQAAREAHITAEELAQRIGCSRSLIYQYLSGVSLIQTDRLQQIAKEVGKPIEWFFHEGGVPFGTEVPASTAALDLERNKLQEEQARLSEERAAFEERREREYEAQLYALIEAGSSPPDWRKVADYCQQLTSILERNDRTQELAELLLKQGNALLQLQEWGAARERLERAGSLFRQLELSDRALSCLQSLGHANVMLGRVEEALEQFRQVEAGEDWWNRWQGALSAGAALELLGNYSEATECFAQATAIAFERGDSPDNAFAQLFIEANWANVELDFGDLRSALNRADRCIRLAQKHGVQDQYIEALITRGSAFLLARESRSATAAFQQAFDLAELTKDHQRWSLALSGMALGMSAARESAGAIANGKEALAIALRCGASRAEVIAQRALAAAYGAAGNPAESLYHAQQGLELATNNRLRLPQAELGIAKANAQLGAGSVKEAAATARAALSIADDLGAIPVQYECHLTLAKAALAAKSAKDALHHSRLALALAETLEVPELLWLAYSTLGQAHLLDGSEEKAQSELASGVQLVQSIREKLLEESLPDTLMEDPETLNLWKVWLGVRLKSAGRDEALREAEAATWPPLVEWLEAVSGPEKRKAK
jgi:tetratricopeptide (TPR) repeat protein